MTVEKNITSEEKLLRLIRQKELSSSRDGSAEAKKHDKKNSITPLKFFNVALFGLALVFFGLLVMKNVSDKEGEVDSPVTSSRNFRSQETSGENRIFDDKPDLSEYRDKIVESSIFKAPWDVDKEAAGMEGSVPGNRGSTLIRY